jgi:hypothetical protein
MVIAFKWYPFLDVENCGSTEDIPKTECAASNTAEVAVLWIYQYIPLFLIYLSLYYFSDIFSPAII